MAIILNRSQSPTTKIDNRIGAAKTIAIHKSVAEGRRNVDLTWFVQRVIDDDRRKCSGCGTTRQFTVLIDKGGVTGYSLKYLRA